MFVQAIRAIEPSAVEETFIGRLFCELHLASIFSSTYN